MRPMESSAKRGQVPVEPSSVSHDPVVDYPIHRCKRVCKCGAVLTCQKVGIDLASGQQ